MTGREFKSLREAAGLSQEAVAKALHTNQTRISRVEGAASGEVDADLARGIRAVISRREQARLRKLKAAGVEVAA